MKLKKGVKKIVTIIMVLLVVVILFFSYRLFFTGNSKVAKETKVVDEIKTYGYELHDRDNQEYKNMFKELQKILSNKEIDEEAYVKQIAKMFIYDFYTLSNKDAKTDIGGKMFVYQGALANFLTKAENTMYKHIENDLYGDRKQELPTVDKVTVEKVETLPYSYQDTADANAYQVQLSWTYIKDLEYQTEATLTFIHEDNKLSLIVLE